MQRGMIRNKARKRQIHDMSQVRYGNITPTDVDFAFDFRGKYFVFGESKYGDAPLGDGQRSFLGSLCLGLSESGRKAMAIIARHNVEDTSQDVPLHESIVSEIWWDGKWRALEGKITVVQAVDRARVRWEIDREPGDDDPDRVGY